MKRFAALLCAVLLLCGCGVDVVPPTQPTAEQTEAAASQPAGTAPVETTLPETLPAGTVPYTRPLHAAVPIFGGPSYDDSYLRAVGEDGVYTIIEEVHDTEGNLWGRLKSGAGWVDLTALDDDAPITAAFADAAFSDENCHTYTAEESEFLVRLIFRAREPLTDVQFSLLEPDPENWTAYSVYESLHTLPALEPGTPFVAGVVFYGDLTAYGLSFTDDDGNLRHYAVTISGRNGAPVLTEYIP